MTRRTPRVAMLAAIMFVAGIAPQPVSAAEPLRPFIKCLPDAVVPCIEGITVTLPDGSRVAAQVTGRLEPVNRAYAPDSVLEGTWQEWQVPGASFADGRTNRFLAELFLFPYGARDCFYDPCVDGGEYVEFVLRPSDFDVTTSQVPLHFPYADSDYACGVKAAPSLCYPPLNFGSGYAFEVSVLVPNAFTGTVASGRGTRDLTVVASAGGANGLRRIVLSGSPAAYWSYGLPGSEGTQYGYLRLDSMQFWLWGSRDLRVSELGSCGSKPQLVVAANAFWVNMPSWNPATQSVEVRVQAPHFGADGSDNVGMLQAQISREMAACLWSVDVSKSVQAQVGLSYGESGQEQIQTFTTKYANNTYFITVTGMHFSSPTVSLKLSQPAPAPAVKKRVSTIVCTRSSATRRVTGTNPVCPKGWKVKR